MISAYSQYTNLDPSKVLVSRGADEGIELLIRAFCQPGVDNVLICPPTYGMYAISANTFNVGVKVAPLLPNFELDVAAINAHKTGVKLVFICAPNNPTGTVPSKTDIESIINTSVTPLWLLLMKHTLNSHRTRITVTCLNSTTML